MITLSNITKSYSIGEIAVHALRGVSLSIEPGEFVAIMGPSGSGKSTLMHILGLLDVPDSGFYTLMGHEVTNLPDNTLAALRNAGIGFVFQHFNLLPRISAMENTVLPMLYSLQETTPSKAEQVLENVGLGSRMDHKPNELSGGEQQRVAIARALVHDPRIILADEPTGNLDSVSAGEILDILSRLNDMGMTVIIVTHESSIAERAQRIIRMADGLIQTDEPNISNSQSRAGKTFSSASAFSPVTKRSAIETSKDGATQLEISNARSSLLLKEIPNHVKQAWRSLISNKTRSLLSMLGILIGVGAVIAMMAIGTGARRSIEKQLSSLGSNLLVLRPGARRMHGVALEAGAVTRFTPEDARDIKNEVPFAKRVSGTVYGRGQATFKNKNWNTRVLGTSPEYANMRAYQPAIGRFFTNGEVKKRARVAVIGMTLVRELFKDDNPLGETIKINKVIFQVIGVLPEKGATGWRDQDDMIIIPVSTAMYRLLGKDYLDSIDIEVTSAYEMDAAQDAIRSVIMRNHRLSPSRQNSFSIRNMAEILSALTSTSRTMAWLLLSIAAISLLVGGIGIMNIMLVSVTERTREIGIRKAIGARRRDILAQFLTEALVISLAGGAIGVLLGWTISLTITNLAGWPVEITLASIFLACGFSGFIGVVFGLWPARKASLLNPIDALRYE